jgi:hypothetical protein
VVNQKNVEIEPLNQNEHWVKPEAGSRFDHRWFSLKSDDFDKTSDDYRTIISPQI